MPAVIDVNGATLRDEPVPALFSEDLSGKHERRCFGQSSASWPTAAPGLHRPFGATKSQAAAESPGAKRGPAAPGKVRSGRRSGATEGSSSALSRAATKRHLIRRNAGPAFWPRSCDRFQSDCVTLFSTEGFNLTKTRDLAALLYGSPKAAEKGDRTLVVYAPSEAEPLGVQLARIGRNLRRVAITHAGALDVKDVLGFPRLCLTAAAFDALASASHRRERARWKHATSSSRR